MQRALAPGGGFQPGTGVVVRCPRQQARAEISTLGRSVDGEFWVEVRSEGRTALIVVSGELDLASGPALEDELARVLASRVELVVLDLRELEFMDSTGLSILVKANQRAVDEGRRFGLARGSPQVQRLLDLTGVAERLALVDTPEELLD